MNEDKIEVGEYVRTDEGDIFEFGGYFKNGNIDSMTDKFGTLYGKQEKCCKKHSKNIIDLIEVGDYYNGIPIVHKLKDGRIQLLTGYLLLNEDIKKGDSIVTKEQFKSVEYEV